MIEIHITEKDQPKNNTYALIIDCGNIEKETAAARSFALYVPDNDITKAVPKTDLDGNKVHNYISNVCGMCYGNRVDRKVIEAFIGVKKDDVHKYDITAILIK